MMTADKDMLSELRAYAAELDARSEHRFKHTVTVNTSRNHAIWGIEVDYITHVGYRDTECGFGPTLADAHKNLLTVLKHKGVI